jgi:hypothetical protein
MPPDRPTRRVLPTPEAIIQSTWWHNAAIGLLVASCVVGLGGYYVGRREFIDRESAVPTQAAVAGLAGAVGILVAVVLLAVGS